MSATDMNVEMENIVGEVVDCFEEKMLLLFKEKMIEQQEIKGLKPENLWKSQVTNCGLDLVVAIDELIEKFETKVRSGEYLEVTVLR